jgi:hypothetical protein
MALTKEKIINDLSGYSNRDASDTLGSGGRKSL